MLIKHYTVNINGHHEVISIDHLKSAFLKALSMDQHLHPLADITTKEDPSLTTKPHTVTHSGHHVHWPEHLSSTFIYPLGGVV